MSCICCSSVFTYASIFFIPCTSYCSFSSRDGGCFAVAIVGGPSGFSLTVSFSKLCSNALIGVSGVLISELLRFSAGSSTVSLNSLSSPPLFLALILRNAAWYFSNLVPGWASIHSSSSPISFCSSRYRCSSCSCLSRPLLNLVSILNFSSLASWVWTPPYTWSHRCQ